MNEHVAADPDVPAKPNASISDADYDQIMQKLDRLAAEIEETRKLVQLAVGRHVSQGEWYRKPGRLKGQFEVGPEFFEPLTDEELKEMGFE